MIRISKRADMPPLQATLIRIASIVVALLLMSVFFSFLGHNPIDVYASILRGSLGSAYRLRKTMELMVPLSIAALGVAVAFKMKFWNIGGEGQIIVGAVAATALALKFGHLPAYILLPLMFLASVAAGATCAFIPAFFKVKYGTNETLFTLMLNYLAEKLVIYLQYGPWKDPGARGFAKIANFSQSARLPQIFGVHIGWVMLILLVIGLYLLMNRMKLGYEIAVIGISKRTAEYAGMDVPKIIVRAVVLSGAICGLVGLLQVSGINYTLSYEVGGGMGFTAIIIAWLAQLKVLLIPVVGFLFSILVQGASFIQIAFTIPQSVAQILQAIILFFTLGSEFFIRYQLHFERKAVR